MDSKKTNDAVKEFFKVISKPPTEESLQEAMSNRMSVGNGHDPDVITFSWQPHNYRLVIDFNKANFNHPNRPTTDLPKFEGGKIPFSTGFSYKPTNHNSSHLFMNFNFCNVLVRKDTVEVQNKSQEKQWHIIKADSIDAIEEEVFKIVKELDEQIMDTLKFFIGIWGGESSFTIRKRFSEDGTWGDEFLDSIPEEMRIHHSPIFKKLYKKKTEFYGPAKVVNYIQNRAVEKIAPQIAQSIDGLGSQQIAKLDELIDAVKILNTPLKSVGKRSDRSRERMPVREPRPVGSIKKQPDWFHAIRRVDPKFGLTIQDLEKIKQMVME